MNGRSISSFLLVCTLILAAGAGCGGSDGDGDGDKDSTEGSAAEGIKNADCVALSEACHEFDEGAGEASECHAIAHNDVAAPCKQARTRCLAACK